MFLLCRGVQSGDSDMNTISVYCTSKVVSMIRLSSSLVPQWNTNFHVSKCGWCPLTA